MSEKQVTSKPAPRSISDFATEFLDDKAVAIIIKQNLLPDDVENPVIFPPTYLKAKGKSQNDDKDDKSQKKESKQDQQKSVYNLDDLGDGKNVVEIDSPQSDGNKSEPLFKSEELKHLVPQVVISVNGTPVNLLDAGHRAGDAVVRLSSLAARFHNAFTRADVGDHSILATLAPTSILYGAWDSRSTQTKLQRIMKAGVRAQNVRPLTKSATFIPAAEYVKLRAVKEELDVGEGDNNPLSSEGLKYALASQSLGGVLLTDPKLLIRTIKINLVALRALQAKVEMAGKKPDDKSTDEEKKAYGEAVKKTEARTTALRNYILGLALVAATSDPDLNLREGCNLRISGEDDVFLVKHRKDDELIKIDRPQAIAFAKTSGEAFFNIMDIEFAKKDHLEAIFEKDVAEEFLGLKDAKGNLSGTERDKVRALGPITRKTLNEYYAAKKRRDKAGDPVDALRKLVDAVAVDDKKDKFKSTKPTAALRERLKEIAEDNDSNETIKTLANGLSTLLTDESGAKDRKSQMLALFPIAPVEQPAAASTETPATPEAL